MLRRKFLLCSIRAGILDMRAEYFFAITLSVCIIGEHILRVSSLKRERDLQAKKALVRGKSFWWQIVLSIIQVNVGNTYLIRPIKSGEINFKDPIWGMAIVLYFIACCVFIGSAVYYRKIKKLC